MKALRIGFIGTGRRKTEGSTTGYAMAYAHAEGYKKLPRVELAACADIVKDNARAFADANGCHAVYTDYKAMLRKEHLDVVSICTWPALHADMAVACAKARVKAVHCEKPMAVTFGDCVRMTKEAAKARMRLCFNHQRRFGAPYQGLLKLKTSGKLGKLLRMESYCPNLYDWGTHWVDMLQMFNDETPAEWVLAQADCTKGNQWFGAPQDNQSIVHAKYKNGVQAYVVGGADSTDGVALRLIGDHGTAELRWSEPILRAWTKGSAFWKEIPVKDELHGGEAIDRAVAATAESARGGPVSMLCAEHALRGAEIIFGGYESSRRRERVTFPLTITDNPIAERFPRPKAAHRT